MCMFVTQGRDLSILIFEGAFLIIRGFRGSEGSRSSQRITSQR